MAKTKQAIIIRNDLNMRKGKMCSQAAHASMAVITTNMNIISDDGEYKGAFEMTEAFVDWVNNSYTKICLQCSSEEELLELHSKAKAEGIICSLIKDNGLTEFKGIPTYTAIAIGPEYSEKIDKITNHLKLF